MPPLRFLLSLFAFVDALAEAWAQAMCVVLMLRFPPLLDNVLLTC